MLGWYVAGTLYVFGMFMMVYVGNAIAFGPDIPRPTVFWITLPF